MIANGGLIETQHSASSTPCSAIGSIQIRNFLGTVYPIVNIPVPAMDRIHLAKNRHLKRGYFFLDNPMDFAPGCKDEPSPVSHAPSFLL